MQQTSRRNESQAVNPKLEVESVKDVQSSYPAPSTAESPVAEVPVSVHSVGLKDPRQFSHEVAHPNLARQPTSQNERNAKREGEPIETAVRTMTCAETAGLSSPILKPSKLPGETDESGLQPGSIVSFETSAVEPIPAGERRPQSEVRVAKKSRKPYADKLMTELPVPTDAAGTVNLRQFLDEVAQPDLSKSSLQQSERNPKRAAESIEPAVQKEKSAEAVRIPSAKLSERREFPWFTKRAGQGEEKQLRPLVGTENREETKASHLSVRAASNESILPDNEPSQAELLFRRTAVLMPKSDSIRVRQMDVLRSHAEPSASPLSVERESEAPTIQVTIGRVEIRATLPTPPSRKTLPKAPAMSLDDYLKQRSGGRR
jgi:hypothetical protein